MDRVTLRVPREQVEAVEQLVETGEYPNRSEAIRAAIRELLNDSQPSRGRRTTRPDGGRPADRDPSRDQPDYYRDWSQR